MRIDKQEKTCDTFQSHKLLRKLLVERTQFKKQYIANFELFFFSVTAQFYTLVLLDYQRIRRQQPPDLENVEDRLTHLRWFVACSSHCHHWHACELVYVHEYMEPGSYWLRAKVIKALCGGGQPTPRSSTETLRVEYDSLVGNKKKRVSFTVAQKLIGRKLDERLIRNVHLMEQCLYLIFTTVVCSVQCTFHFH